MKQFVLMLLMSMTLLVVKATDNPSPKEVKQDIAKFEKAEKHFFDHMATIKARFTTKEQVHRYVETSTEKSATIAKALFKQFTSEAITFEKKYRYYHGEESACIVACILKRAACGAVCASQSSGCSCCYDECDREATKCKEKCFVRTEEI